jgi:hypothetical protein
MSMNATGAARVSVRQAAAAPMQGGLTQLLLRIRSEYEEMPGLCLTRAQAQRLWGLDADACDAVLSALVDIGYLKTTRTGYVRV